MIDSLDNVLENSSEPGLPELRAVLREFIGGLDPTARVIDQQRLKPRVYRLRVEANGCVRSLVLKRLEPAVAQRNQLVAQRWLPAIGLSEVGSPYSVLPPSGTAGGCGMSMTTWETARWTHVLPTAEESRRQSK